MVHWGFFFMEQLSKSKDDQIIYQRNYFIHWFKCGYRLHQRYQQVFVSKCYQMLVQFFLQSFERGNTPSEQRISGEKCLLKGNFKYQKMVSSSGGTHWTFWLYSSYIATVFSPHFCFLKSHLSEPVTRLNWYFWLLRLKYPAPVIWAISLSNSLLGDSFHTQLEDEFIYKRDEKQEGLLYP